VVEPPVDTTPLNYGTVNTVLSPGDAIVALKQTVKGGPNILAERGGNEGVAKAIDGDLNTKYLGKSIAENGDNSGVETGFAITPSAGGSTITEIQFATGGDVPERDPLSITLEGSNDPNATDAQGNGFTLIYEGSTGLENDPGRNKWGPVISFKNETAYKTYRVLITQTRDDGSDSTQYSEVRLGN
jgi:hypothetical protein